MSQLSKTDSSSWDFYGRDSELQALCKVLDADRWFFVRVGGRRRIGKTSLVREALRRSGRDRVAYLQVDDADPAAVVATARRHLSLCGVPDGMLPVDLVSLAATLADLAAAGWVVVLDEFQWFSRKSLYPFNGMLQFEVDRFLTDRRAASGGMIVLGSIQTEMVALLDDRRAPLYGRLSGSINLGHLDARSVVRILSAHADLDPKRLLFLWGLFQGVPKYWRDAWAQGVLTAPRTEVLKSLFFDPPAPLQDEGRYWLVEELRGRYDLFLRYIAEHPGASNADIVAHAAQVKGYGDAQPGFYLGALEQRFQLIRRRTAALAARTGRNGRYEISDNFLRSWLAALADPVALQGMRPTNELVAIADERLATAEGASFEGLVAWLFEERSRLGVGEFALTAPAEPWWDRVGAEIDVVVCAEPRRVMLCSCKRSATKLVADLPQFERHIGRFLERHPELRQHAIVRSAIAPDLTQGQRRSVRDAGYVPLDLTDLLRGLV